MDTESFYRLIAGYPDCVIDYCLVKNEHTESGLKAHRNALLRACRELFADENGEMIWQFDVGKAEARRIAAEELFLLPERLQMNTDGGRISYGQAFLLPPWGCEYTEKDFRIVNAALFPNGTDALEAYEWTTGWSEYFDEGHEWWGTLCLTVYDNSLDRFAVIMASATD